MEHQYKSSWVYAAAQTLGPMKKVIYTLSVFSLAYLLFDLVFGITSSTYDDEIRLLYQLSLVINIFVSIVAFLLFAFEVTEKASYASSHSEWLRNVVESKMSEINIKIEAISSDKSTNDTQVESTEAIGTKEASDAVLWPWGSHHTKHLGDLAAAAKALWTLYDPSDPSTAPTNEMVRDWLVTERGVSKDKASAMASILRADGLPSGRR